MFGWIAQAHLVWGLMLLLCLLPLLLLYSFPINGLTK